MTIDPLQFTAIIFTIGAVSGYIGGYGTVRMNHLLIIISGTAWKSGNARKRYNLILAYGAMLYLICVYVLFYPGEGSTVKLLSVLLFIPLFVAGIKHAERGFKQSQSIMKAIIKAMYEPRLESIYSD